MDRLDAAVMAPGLGPALLLLIAALGLGLFRLLSATAGPARSGHVAGRPDEKEAPGPRPELPAMEPLHDFDWRAAEPLRLRPFKPIYHITMGLRSDRPSDLVTIDRDYLDRVTLRRHLVSRLGDGVHGCLPGGVSAVRELYSYLLGEHLPTRFPTLFALSADKACLTNRVTAKTWPTAPPEDGAAALRVLAETIEEDVFLLRETDDGHRALAFVCCFPSGFDPSSKLGKLLRDIHTPVPSYDKIAASMERFFSRMQVGKSVKRLNWGIQTDGELYKSETHGGDDAAEAGTDADVDIDQTYLRVELQTLTRLPQTRSLLFSFKTYLYPLRQIKEEGLGSELADAVDGLDAGNAPGMSLYKGRARWWARVCEYLRAEV